MRVQHNIMAMGAYRNYTNNVSSMQKNLERLSSGYKINRAGDDAAGLAISEKMRAQITGLEVAQKNAKDGISLVQTAEGALQEVHDMLNRMVELATMSANGTYNSETDREQLQKEIEQLKSEIDRIADSANFNGINLLDGSMAITDAKAAWSEKLNFTGMDRILKSVIGEGEQAWGVNNVKTVFDSYAGTATCGKFSVDFSNLKFKISFSGKSSATLTAKDIGEFTVKIGDLEIKVSGKHFASTALKGVTATASTHTVSGKIKASHFAQAILNALKDIKGNAETGVASNASKAVVTINGVEWKATVSNGKLTFTQVNEPTNADEARTNFSVSIEFTQAEKRDFKVTMSGPMPDGTKTETAGVYEGANRRAETVFELTADDIVDGAKITLGSKTFILAIGQNSKYANESDTTDTFYVKVLNMEEGAEGILNAALSKLGEVASTTTFTVKDKDGNDKDVKFNIYVTDNGIAVLRASEVASTGQIYFTKLEDLAKFFDLSYTKNHEAQDAQVGLTLQIGDTAESFNQLVVSIEDCHVSSLGLADIDISTQTGAQEAVDKIKDAINYVSDVRGTLGATQNRLDHTINNLSVMTENIQDAESTIRDTDVAEEMMAYTKNNILIQAAQAMLAQANQVPQGVLQLLQ